MRPISQPWTRQDDERLMAFVARAVRPFALRPRSDARKLASELVLARLAVPSRLIASRGKEPTALVPALPLAVRPEASTLSGAPLPPRGSAASIPILGPAGSGMSIAQLMESAGPAYWPMATDRRDACAARKDRRGDCQRLKTGTRRRRRAVTLERRYRWPL